MDAEKPISPAPTSPPGLAGCLLLLGLSLAVAVLFWGWRGGEAAQQYLAGTLIELGLSVDNVLVFLLVFGRLQVPPGGRRRVLAWGVLGAAAMRGAAILAGFALLRRFRALLYLCGGILILAGVRLASGAASPLPFDPWRSAGWMQRRLRISDRFHGDRFFAVEQGRRVATRLLLALLVIETADLIFAVDSLPAVLAVTRSRAVALASNLLAVLVLRSLTLAVGAARPRFRRLRTGLALVLALIGVKMLLQPWMAVPTWATLALVGGILLGSLLAGRSEEPPPPLRPR